MTIPPQPPPSDPYSVVSMCRGGVSVHLTRYAPGERMGRHAHDVASVSMVLRGGVEEESSDRRFVAATGDCVVKPVGAAHANHFGPGATRMLQLEFDTSRHHAGEEQPAIPAGLYGLHPMTTLTPAMFGLYRALCNSAPTGERDERLTDVLGAIASLPAQKLGRAPGWMCRVERDIELGLDARLRVSALAASVGVHPVHLSRVFHRAHGCGVMSYIHRRRVRRAIDLLATSRRPLADIAAALGFADQAHLTRVFHQVLGQPPGAFRRMVDA